MPCLNEAKTIGLCIEKAKKSILKHKLDAEILIADNGSADNSAAIAIDLGARVVNVSQKGYGNTLWSGILNSRGKFVIMGDSDCSYDFEDIFLFIERLRMGDDLVMGNRFKGGIEKNAMPFLHRYLGNPVLSYIGRLFYEIPIGDFHCGLRGMNKDAIVSLNLSSKGMEFASEMVVKSSLNNLKLSEVPIRLYPDLRGRPPHLKTWSDGWRHLRFLLLHNPKWLFLVPGSAMFIVGLFVTVFIFFKPIKVGKISFDIGTMLYTSTMLIIGFQLISFYVFCHIVSLKSGISREKTLIISFLEDLALEKQLIVGFTITLAGIVLVIKSLTIWDKSSYGHLDPEEIIRIVILSASCLLLGIQIIFNSFFHSFLKRK